MALYEGALDGISGYADFSDVFNVTEEEVDAFDKSFPLKEKKYQASQDEYDAASIMLDEKGY